MNPIRRLLWWAADYLYAGRHQLAVLSLPWTVGLPRPTPPAWRTGDPGLPEIVLLPGVYEHWTFLRPLGSAIADAGYRVRVIHGLGMNRRSVPDTAARLTRALAKDPVPPAGRVLVAHSKGGLIGKRALLDADAAAAALPAETGRGRRGAAPADLGLRGLVAVATPFAGSWMARLLPLDPSIREFRPDDATIRTLGVELAVNARIVSVFGPYDPHIPEGSRLEGAMNIEVPSPGHFRLLGSASTHRAVIDGIRHVSDPGIDTP
ncbi:esterase/lipase family protein [Microbacterium thalassium]|uniref:Alpha/beta hydrolase n=1 Tax=Microbacterium thalassium TaxID=362649 RepID=A0A7X0FSQ8_9MICO|nr:hypothetical protein [Microbacterium thalassium]MBB6393028.1 hypothetical protein [Microbacterium thalassium]GLK22741.1 hypothetical protein GCM10017607_00590 [Microbacterium thalassium]